MVDAVAAPRPAAQAESLPHAVPQVATVGGCLGLIHQNPAGFRSVRKGHDLEAESVCVRGGGVGNKHESTKGMISEWGDHIKK